jgi:hypothetical protein
MEANGNKRRENADVTIHPTRTIHHQNSMYSSGKRIVSNSHSRSTKIVSYVSSTNPGAGRS